MANHDPFAVTEHEADLCVVGGGPAGLAAALAAARLGARVVLMHDRPVLGGNASSETRVHIMGADRANRIPNMRETGVLEELRLANLRHNPQRSHSIWDTILYDRVRAEPNITLLLNCSCLDADTDATGAERRIRSVTGWQLTTQTYHRVRATLFADCSGDAVLAPLSGAHWRMGREARREYGESIAPPEADARTMGMSCLFMAREHATPQPFTPPSWAYRFDDDDIPGDPREHQWLEMGYWWVELGGEADAIADTEALRDELLRIVYGLWDHIKNRGQHGAANWALDWVQFLPAKRESRRYLGDHVLTQNDIEAEGRFADVVAYGGWTMDDHNPAGFWSARRGAPATIFHPAPSPYGIPFRALYSRNVANLLFAGRCASCTHAAMSSTRVMGTAFGMGQAVGTAAALAIAHRVSPRELGGAHMDALQQALLRQDCYLPWVPQRFSALTREATLRADAGDPEPLRDGINRPVGAETHAWEADAGEGVEYTWGAPRPVGEVSIVCDSALHRHIQMTHHGPFDQLTQPPPELLKDARLEVRHDGVWRTWCEVTGNYQRLLRLTLDAPVTGVRLTPRATWGAERVRLFAFYLDEAGQSM